MHLGHSTTIEENDEEESEQQDTVEFEKVVLRNDYVILINNLIRVFRYWAT